MSGGALRKLAVTVGLLSALTGQVGASACGGDDAPLDAMADATAPAERGELPTGADVLAPAEAAAPLPPDMGACPEGWRSFRREEGDPPACAPWPEEEAASCAGHELHLPGDEGCRPVGRACPSERFASAPSDRTVHYVDAQAAEEGSGSRDAPFLSLREALDAAQPGDAVLLAPGRYADADGVSEGVLIEGACSETVLIEPPASELTLEDGSRIAHATVAGTIEARGEDVALEGVVVHASDAAGVRVSRDARMESVLVRITSTTGSAAPAVETVAGARLDAHNLVVRGGVDAGLALCGTGTEATFERVAVRGVTPATRRGGVGVRICDGAHARFTELVIEDVHDFGIEARGDGSEAIVEGGFIRRAQRVSGPSSGMGRAAGVRGGATLELRRTALLDNVRGGASVQGGELSLEDVVLVDNHGFAPANAATGVYAREGHLKLTRVFMRRQGNISLLIDRGATMDALDTRIVDTLHTMGTRRTGIGVAQAGGSLVARRLAVTGSTFNGILIALAGTQARLVDTEVNDTRPDPGDGLAGIGMVVGAGPKVSLERVTIASSHETGLQLAQVGSFVRAHDLIVRDTAPVTAGMFEGMGIGVRVQDDARLELDRALIERNRGWGVIFTAETTGTVRNLRLRDTRPLTRIIPIPTRLGRGFEVQSGGEVELVRSIVESNRDSGIAVTSGGGDVPSRLTVRDTIVRGTRGSEGVGLEGRGVVLYGPGAIQLEDVRVEDNQAVSLSAYGDSSRIDATRTEILDTRVRLCADTDCPDEPAGIGVGAYDGATVALADFLVARAALAGVQVGETGAVDLRNGEVTGCPIGVNIQNSSFDPARLTEDVAFRDNERNLDSIRLPVPERGAELDGRRPDA